MLIIDSYSDLEKKLLWTKIKTDTLRRFYEKDSSVWAVLDKDPKSAEVQTRTGANIAPSMI